MNAKAFISKIFVLSSFLILQFGYAATDNTQTLNTIEQRIKPVGQVNVEQPKIDAATTGATTTLSGKEVYEKSCTACHASGAAGAPKFADKDAWKARIAQGKETLYKHAVQGFKLMPPKGTCMTCSDKDIQNAVDYMIKEAGG